MTNMTTFTCKAILFDLDGTLVDSSHAVNQSWAQWATDNQLDIQHIKQTSHGRPGLEIIKEYLPTADPLAELKKLEDLENSYIDSVQVMPNAISLLNALQPHQWAIVTSGTRPIALPRIQKLGGLMPTALVTASDIAHGKPHPEPFLLGAAKLGIAPEDCVVLEDSPAGINAALAAGMRCIGLTTTHSETAVSHATAVIPTIAQLTITLTKENILHLSFPN